MIKSAYTFHHNMRKMKMIKRKMVKQLLQNEKY